MGAVLSTQLQQAAKTYVPHAHDTWEWPILHLEQIAVGFSLSLSIDPGTATHDPPKGVFSYFQPSWVPKPMVGKIVLPGLGLTFKTFQQGT